VDSKHLILDSGLSYALIPSEDFKALTTLLSKSYGVTCAASAEAKKDKAQVNASSCTCKDYTALPALKFSIFATGEDKTGKQFSLPRETYMKDEGAGKCQLLLNPNDMQIGARYGENYWIMGDQFMQAYYTIYDHEKWRVGLIESKNTFDTASSEDGGSVKSSSTNIQDDGPAAASATAKTADAAATTEKKGATAAPSTTQQKKEPATKPSEGAKDKDAATDKKEADSAPQEKTSEAPQAPTAPAAPASSTEAPTADAASPTEQTQSAAKATEAESASKDSTPAAPAEQQPKAPKAPKPEIKEAKAEAKPITSLQDITSAQDAVAPTVAAAQKHKESAANVADSAVATEVVDSLADDE
jgi:hypothetical protein